MKALPIFITFCFLSIVSHTFGQSSTQIPSNLKKAFFHSKDRLLKLAIDDEHIIYKDRLWEIVQSSYTEQQWSAELILKDTICFYDKKGIYQCKIEEKTEQLNAKINGDELLVDGEILLTEKPKIKNMPNSESIELGEAGYAYLEIMVENPQSLDYNLQLYATNPIFLYQDELFFKVGADGIIRTKVFIAQAVELTNWTGKAKFKAVIAPNKHTIIHLNTDNQVSFAGYLAAFNEQLTQYFKHRFKPRLTQRSDMGTPQELFDLKMARHQKRSKKISQFLKQTKSSEDFKNYVQRGLEINLFDQLHLSNFMFRSDLEQTRAHEKLMSDKYYFLTNKDQIYSSANDANRNVAFYQKKQFLKEYYEKNYAFYFLKTHPELLNEEENIYINKVASTMKNLPHHTYFEKEVNLMAKAINYARQSKDIRKLIAPSYRKITYQIDTLLNYSKELSAKEKLQLQKFQESLLPYKQANEKAKELLSQHEANELLEEAFMLEKARDWTENERLVLVKALHYQNIAHLEKKYKKYIPAYLDYYATGRALTELTLDSIAKPTHLMNFFFVLEKSSPEYIEEVYTAIQQLDLGPNESVYLQHQYEATISKFGRPMPNFANINQVESESGEALLAEISKKYAGKVIYLDIWATWCSPCLHEMRNGKATKAYYKDKDVVFVYLCGGGCTKESMESKIRQLEIEGEHFVLTKRQNSDLFRILEGKGYPTYRIIDQEGNLVRNAEPRPSNLKFVRQFIDPLLQK